MQKYFPHLAVTVNAYAAAQDKPNVQVQVLDSAKPIGPIPAIIQDTLASVQEFARHCNRGAADGYPARVVREAVTNALMHRDYSPLARGTQVQVGLYPDRLEVLSPGGLYGTVAIETLGKPSCSSKRNQYLANLLEFTPYEDGFVAENRGTGFNLMSAKHRKNNILR